MRKAKRRRRSSTRLGRRSPIILAAALLACIITAMALASNNLNLFALVGQKVIGGVTVKYEVDPTPPIKITVDDLGKTYTFRVKLTFEAPSSYHPASIIPLFQPSSYYEIQNPLTVPAKIKSPTGSPITFRGLEPFAIALDPETGKYISPYHLETAETKTKTKTTQKTSEYQPPPYAKELPSSDNYIPPGGSYSVDPSTIYYKPLWYVTATETAQRTTYVEGTTVIENVPTTHAGYRCEITPHIYRDYWVPEDPSGPWVPDGLKSILLNDRVGWVVTIHHGTTLKEFYLSKGSTKTYTYTFQKTIGESSLELLDTVKVEVYKWIVKSIEKKDYVERPCTWRHERWIHVKLDRASGSLVLSGKLFTTTPLSKGLHIQNVVTDIETGKVSYELVNDWITPIKVMTGLTDGTIIVSSGGPSVPKKTLTIPPQGKVKVEFTVSQAKSFFYAWHPGRPTTFKKTISACILPEGEQELFGGPSVYQCVSAPAVWKYIPPEVEIGLEVSGQGSVIVKHDGKTVTPPFKARIGDTVTVEMRGAEGYVVGVYGFKKPDGKYLYHVIGGSSLKEHEAPKEKTWSFVVKSPGKIFVDFVVPKSVRTYTTKVGNKTKTAVILPSGEEFIKPEHPLASECLTFAVKVKYSGHVVNAFNAKKWEEKEKLQGSMKIILIAENTCPDDPIEVKLGIHLGGPINAPAMYAERHAELKARIEPNGRVERSIDVSLDGLTVYRASGDRYRLHFEYTVQARYPDVPGDSWKAVPPYSIPVLIFTPTEKAYSQTGGITHKPRPDGTEEVEFTPQATEAGIQYPEIQLTKEPGISKIEATGNYGAGLMESYQPVAVELKHQPNGDKIETTGVIEPPIASEHETDPGVVSFTPKPPSKSPWQQILEFFQSIWNWLLKVLGLR